MAKRSFSFRHLVPVLLSALSAGGVAQSASAQPAAAQPGPATAPAFWAFAPTRPMGWNSYDAFGDTVTEQEALANAQYMKDKLLAHGWNYVVLDARWYDTEPTGNDHTLVKLRSGAKLELDAYGRYVPAVNRFPSAANGAGFLLLTTPKPERLVDVGWRPLVRSGEFSQLPFRFQCDRDVLRGRLI
jgi:hypothetical protein